MTDPEEGGLYRAITKQLMSMKFRFATVRAKKRATLRAKITGAGVTSGDAGLDIEEVIVLESLQISTDR